MNADQSTIKLPMHARWYTKLVCDHMVQQVWGINLPHRVCSNLTWCALNTKLIMYYTLHVGELYISCQS